MTASREPRGNPGTARRGRVALAHLVVAMVGSAFLTWSARPFSGPASESLPNAGFWQLLVGSAVLIGGIGGVLEGIALRYGKSALAVGVLVVAAVAGLWMPLLSLGRWYTDQRGDHIETGALVAGLAGWFLLMVIVAALAATTSVIGRRRSPHDQ